MLLIKEEERLRAEKGCWVLLIKEEGKSRRREVDGMLGVDKGGRKVSAPRKRVYIGGGREVNEGVE